MIVNALGIVLSRRHLGEADRLSTIYTENLGKIHARCVSVNRPGRKLKALSEPLVWAEFRLYMSPKSDMAKMIGGQIISSFPHLREDLNRTMTALSFCESLSSITPDHLPNEEKYQLLCSALQALESGESPWLFPAYGLQLLKLAGHSMADEAMPQADQALWNSLHHLELAQLQELPQIPNTPRKFEDLVLSRIKEHSGREVKSRNLMRQMAEFSEGSDAVLSPLLGERSKVRGALSSIKIFPHPTTAATNFLMPPSTARLRRACTPLPLCGRGHIDSEMENPC